MGLGFLGLFGSMGIRSSFGAYVTSWEEEFEVSRSMVTIISTLSLVVYGVFQPVTGRMNDRYGARPVLTVSMLLIGISLIISSYITDFWQLAIVYGIIASIGFSGASNVTGTAAAARWFHKKQGTVMGIVLSGMAVGQLIIVPVSLYIISTYHWRISMLVSGLIITFLIVPLCYFFMRSKPSDIGLQAYGEEESTQHTNTEHESTDSLEQKQSVYAIMKSKYFWMIAAPYFICGFTDVGFVQTHFIPYTEGTGVPTRWIMLTLSLIAIFNLFGTVGSGYLSDKMHRGKLLAIIFTLRAITYMILLSTDSIAALIIFGMIYGLTDVAAITPTSSVCAHLFERYSIGVIFGFISVSHQVGAAAGSWIPGLLYDLYGSYTLSIWFSAIFLVISAWVVYQIPDTQKKEFSIKNAAAG
ncbi:MFS transporter [Paenibacillus sp. PvP091]|uniref:MFS transporter n=1 Tax=Paenibacillus sp. PvP091 TaxID=2806590 RepID=UPI0032AEB52C